MLIKPVSHHPSDKHNPVRESEHLFDKTCFLLESRGVDISQMSLYQFISRIDQIEEEIRLKGKK